MEGTNVVVKEVKILETADDIQDRREQVLSRYQQFRAEAKIKRDKLEESRKFQVSFNLPLSVNFIFLFIKMNKIDNIVILSIFNLL